VNVETRWTKRRERSLVKKVQKRHLVESGLKRQKMNRPSITQVSRFSEPRKKMGKRLKEGEEVGLVFGDPGLI